MREYFKSKNILKHCASHKEIKAGVCEAINRVYKERLYKMFTETENLRWVDAIQDIIHGLNHTPSRTTGMRPVDVNFENAREVWKRVYGGERKEDRSTAIQPDDHVYSS